MEDRIRRWLPVLVVVVALAAAGVAAGGSGLSGHEVPPPSFPDPQEHATPTPPPQVTPLPQLPVPETEGGVRSGNPALLIYMGVFLTLTALLLLYAGYVALRWLMRERIAKRVLHQRAASQPGGAAEVVKVRDAVRAGLADIDAGGDPRRAVIACWLRLERVAAAAGTARLAADTPGDLVARLLTRHLVSRDTLDGLAGAYRRARFAPAEVGDDLVHRAREALQEVDHQLSAPVSAASGEHR